MFFRIATWNINSVRLRIEQVLRYLDLFAPDVLCLQETKCPDALFPYEAFEAMGYKYRALSGQKSYNGVAIVSRVPFESVEKRSFCQKEDCRYISVIVEAYGKKIRIHNLYVPAGGDVPDANINEKFRYKLDFLEEMFSIQADKGDGLSSLLVGDLNIAPLPDDVWSHRQLLKVVSHTPIETECLQALCRQGGWVDLMRMRFPVPVKLYTWWSYRARDWALADRGRRLDHIWSSPDLVPFVTDLAIFRQARGWVSPSDHVPVQTVFDFSS
ncbi:exodeoxyribonuclease III [Bartonella doshiae]|uniref:Exodeoxyribonuclease III n=2 Tax=Bartonella doshiae TaxID=33044 RepID=A0A380ZFP4_BARDO|nr:exodeoxyribonuclease III [Bartonella doshiae]EJF80507.1 exodeoxyribonuclease III (xth) [Bartonella doshiae NCTC 12862 = ATCC 700133]MBB6158816.1 exodeoxyribonuclease-3 [Bartonella doshiae]SUV45767.1 Exodeoxyribonuclease III [Bartonella doshiae]